MTQVIEVASDVYKRLEALVVGFDTPNNVIERLLDFYEGSTRSQPQRKLDGKRLFSNSEIQKRVSVLASKFSEAELAKYCDKQYSKAQLGINFPLFVRVASSAPQAVKKEAVKSADGVPRWSWKYEFHRGAYSYAVCTQWYAAQDGKVQEWLLLNS